LAAADVLYRRVDAGVAQLPLACRPGINAARFLYAAIGHEVARGGLDSVSRRAVVGRSRKAWLLAHALARLSPGMQAHSTPCLEETRFLVEAVAGHSAVRAESLTSAASAWWRIDARINDRAVWVLDLFERLERTERGLPVGRMNAGAG
jgi:phytoene synthase